MEKKNRSINTNYFLLFGSLLFYSHLFYTIMAYLSLSGTQKRPTANRKTLNGLRVFNSVRVRFFFVFFIIYLFISSCFLYFLLHLIYDFGDKKKTKWTSAAPKKNRVHSTNKPFFQFPAHMRMPISSASINIQFCLVH